MSREDLRALMGPSSVIKTVQQQSNARAMALALTRDQNGIFYVFYTVRAEERDGVEKEMRAKAARTTSRIVNQERNESRREGESGREEKTHTGF